MEDTSIHPLIPLGIGIAVGGLAIVALIKLWPVLIIGGGAALALKGANMGQDNTEETDECKSGPAKN